jgi:hypothetical protein
MLDPSAFDRARGCFTAELTALRNDACMLRLPPPTLRRPTPAQYDAARTPAQRRRRRGGGPGGCAAPSACVLAAPRKANPLADLRTRSQAEAARLPKGPWTREDLLNARPDSPHAHATAHARWGRVVRAPPHAPPVFVLTARHLLARRTHVVATLASVSLDDDVTLVLCADAAEARLPDESTCACPCIHMHMCMHMCICICICICM